jgi:hypothetical protein
LFSDSFCVSHADTLRAFKFKKILINFNKKKTKEFVQTMNASTVVYVFQTHFQLVIIVTVRLLISDLTANIVNYP